MRCYAVAMRPRLIVSDLDGTLLDPDGALSEENLAAVDALAAQEIPFILATGRCYIESKFVLQRIQSCRQMIGAAGALLTDTSDGSTLARELLPAELITQVVSRVIAQGHPVQLLQDRSRCEHDYLLVGSAPLHPTMDWWLSSHGLSAHRTDSLEGLDLSHTVRIGVVGGPRELDGLTTRIEEAHGEELVIRHWPAVSETEDQPTYLLELFRRGVDKWTMIEQVVTQMGIDPREVVTIGDGLNDMHMLAKAGLGIAMGQAQPQVKASADRVVGDNREHGFAQAICELLRS